jgi:hypothetical protein
MSKLQTIKNLKKTLRSLGFGGRKSRLCQEDLYIITYKGDDLIAFYSLRKAQSFMNYLMKQYLTKGKEAITEVTNGQM